MKKIIANYFYVIFLTVACNYNNGSNDSIKISDINDIVIYNRTNNIQIPKSIELTDKNSIEEIVIEINQLKPTVQANLKANFGYYALILNFKDKSYKAFSIIYSTYDGVIINGSSNGLVMDRYYKNDKLEIAVLSLFSKSISN